MKTTLDRVKAAVIYDKDTGTFRWRPPYRGNRKAGLGGGLSGHGYIVIRVDGRLYPAHRLAWFYVYGVWPVGEIDHINHVRTDNRIANLRDVSKSVNGENRKKACSNNSSGLLGVSRHGNRFQARISSKGRTRHLGTFNTAEQAHAAYLTEKRVLHEGCTI